MFQIIKKQIDWGGKTLEIETGKIARQASGAVTVRMGGSVVLCTAVAAGEPKEGIDFLPLTVNYVEKYYAAGKIPGGFIKRESRPSEREVLTSRLIDRPIRPLFQEDYNHETQVICTVISYDPDHDTDILATIGASAALAISEIPLLEPIAAARVGYINEAFVLNPSKDEIESSQLDLVVAGTESSVLMVESEAQELPEDVMLNAVSYGHRQFTKVIEIIQELQKEVGKPKIKLQETDYSALEAEIAAYIRDDVNTAYNIIDKQERRLELSIIKNKLLEKFSDKIEDGEITEDIIAGLYKNIQKAIVRSRVLENGKRIDGRQHNEIRQIVGEVDLLPAAHGSALFTRGETQALAVTTLGSTQDEQLVDDMTGTHYDNFYLHYNFPPFSVGETGMLKAPGRREIGHGKLAWRAIRAVLPQREDFPYTVRVVSEITESNGSSSMATVCGTSMSLMAAGVPTKASVSGIAMGLIKENDNYVILSDIMGDEDHLGDMDFKVTGTDSGVTALQMDIKINGINIDIMRQALSQARDGRMHILERMHRSITSSRENLSSYAPRILTMNIKPDKIREVIGSGGKVIKEICEKSNAKVDIDESGEVKIAGANLEAAQLALDMVTEIVAEPEVGEIYEGQVVKIVDFGAFVRFLGNVEGLVHISEISTNKVNNVKDYLQESESVKVKVLSMERNGRLKLSIKAVNAPEGGTQHTIDIHMEDDKPHLTEVRQHTDRESKQSPKKQRAKKKPRFF